MINALISLIILFSFSSNIMAADSIVFAIDPTKPPMQYVSKNGDAVGFEIDFINEMGRLDGFTAVFKRVQWQNLFEGLMNGQFDAACASVSITEGRKATMDFTIPYFQVSQAVLVLKDDKIKNPG